MVGRGWFADAVDEDAGSVEPNGRSSFDWRGALGHYERLPEWLGFYEQLIYDSGWASVAEVWVPRLMPGLASVLFHGAIRTAHAVRAVSTADTGARRAELARSLAYWSARFRAGHGVAGNRDVGAAGSAEVRDAVIEAGRGRCVALCCPSKHLPPAWGHRRHGRRDPDQPRIA